MRNRAKILAAITFSSASILVFGFGVALAQNSSPNSEAPIAGTLGGRVPLSSDEITKSADDALTRMEMSSMQVQQMLGKADQEGDAVKVDCLDDKLNIINTRLRAGKDRRPTLEGSLRSNDSAQAMMLLEIIQNHRKEADKARTQADGCIGADIGYLGDSKTTTTIDPDIPDDTGQPPPILNIPGWGLELPPGTDPSASL